MSGGRKVFLKFAPEMAMLEAERDGLNALRKVTGAPRVPEAFQLGILAGKACLALEFLPLEMVGDASWWREFGRSMACLHGASGEAFGWEKGNFIGLGEQPNGWDDDWPRFFVERRLRPKLEAAGSLLDPAILEKARALLGEKKSRPSLVHGDLWSGNFARHSVSGEPVIFDPAIHYADAEVDLAMMELFAGKLPAAFFESYGPRPVGFERRRAVFDLYHWLNHYLIFGAGYLASVQGSTERILSST